MFWVFNGFTWFVRILAMSSWFDVFLEDSGKHIIILLINIYFIFLFRVKYSLFEYRLLDLANLTIGFIWENPLCHSHVWNRRNYIFECIYWSNIAVNRSLVNVFAILQICPLITHWTIELNWIDSLTFSKAFTNFDFKEARKSINVDPSLPKIELSSWFH